MQTAIESALVLVVAAHLMAVYVAMAAPCLCLWLHVRAARGNLAASAVGRRLLALSLVALAIAVALGLVALWLVLLSHGSVYSAAARQLPARRYWYGIVELAFSAAGMAGWYALWPTPQPAGGRWKHGLGWTFGFLAATNLLYHFPPLFAILGVLSTRPEMWGSGRHFTSLLSDAEVLARTTHHGLASFVTAGIAMAAVASRMARSGGDISTFGKACMVGGRIALVAALVQVPAGAYLLAKLSAEERLQLLRNSPAASVIFALSLAAWFVLVLRLLALSGGDMERRTIRSCLIWMAIVVILMVFVRHLSRHDALRRAGTRVAWCSCMAPDLHHKSRRTIQTHNRTICCSLRTQSVAAANARCRRDRL